MSEDGAGQAGRETVLVVAEQIGGPVVGVLRVLSRALGAPDLDRVAVQTLQEDVVRLYREIESRLGQLTDDVRAKIDPIEAAEIVTQTVVNMGRTASREKRARMRSILLSGLTSSDLSDAERRLFVRLAADLDGEHVAVLRDVNTDIMDPHLRRHIQSELVSRGLLDREEEDEIELVESTRMRLGHSTPGVPELRRRTGLIGFTVTPLALRFLEFLSPPDP